MEKNALLSAIVMASLTLTGCFDSDDDSSNDSRQASICNTGDIASLAKSNVDINGGKVLIYKTDGTYIDAANVGDLPDMVKFVDNSTLVVANEGEPEDDYSSDPEGSISIIKLDAENKVHNVTTLGFEDVELEGEVRIKPNSTKEKDIEPEYVAVSESCETAWVSLQENNAVAIVDLQEKEITSVKGLGKVDVSKVEMDITADDSAAPVLDNPENIFALRMPDTMVAYNVGGQDFFIAANEGDDREYDEWVDYEKAKKLDIDLSAELEAAVVTPDAGMESLRVLNDLGLNQAGDQYDELYIAGTRSFTIFDANGSVVFDSGSDFEKEIAQNYAANFNTRVDDSDDFDDVTGPYDKIDDDYYFWEGVDARSLKKGVEPEALAVHKIGDKVFAYIGLEKQGGFFVYDVTTPADSKQVEYFNDIDYTKKPSEAGDLAPEGMVAFAQDDKNYLAVAHELSSTLAIFELADNGTVTKLTSVKLGSFDEGAAEIVDYSVQDKKLFVTNAETKKVDIVDVATPAQAEKVGSVDFSEYADDLQSVSVKNGLLAIAVK